LQVFRSWRSGKIIPQSRQGLTDHSSILAGTRLFESGDGSDAFPEVLRSYIYKAFKTKTEPQSNRKFL